MSKRRSNPSTKSESRIRILVLIKGLGLGGAERLIADASAVWDTNTFEYTVAYVLPWKDQLVEPIESHGIEVVCIGGRRGLDLRTPFRLRALIAELEPSLIHAHLPSAGLIARISTSVPVVYTEHNVAASYRQPTRTLNRLTYRRNRAAVAVSDAVADSISHFPGSRPKVILNGISVEQPEDAGLIRDELGMNSDSPLVVHVGNIRPHKGHSTLIRAAALLGSRVPGVRVVSVGAEKEPGDLDRVRSEARHAGADDHITFLGRREDARRFLAAADVVVNPSDVEGLPVTLLEALSFSRPVVATDVGGVSQVVINEETGLLVPPGDPVALADAIEVALTDPRASTWGRRGKQLVEERHGLEKMVQAYEELYLTLMGVQDPSAGRLEV
jgi:glycosyltransferase involved in cell wall biosynthesis